MPAERQKKLVYIHNLKDGIDCCELSEAITYLQQLYIEKGDGTIEISGDDVEISLCNSVLETQEEADAREERARIYREQVEIADRRRYEELKAKYEKQPA